MNTQLAGKSVSFKDEDFRTPQLCSLPVPKELDCVQVAMKEGVVAVRSSHDPDKVTAVFTAQEWRYFVAGVKEGQFDI